MSLCRQATDTNIYNKLSWKFDNHFGCCVGSLPFSSPSSTLPSTLLYTQGDCWKLLPLSFLSFASSWVQPMGAKWGQDMDAWASLLAGHGCHYHSKETRLSLLGHLSDSFPSSFHSWILVVNTLPRDILWKEFPH